MSNNNHIVAIVQARIGSSRLPGKVLRDVVGKPMLSHLFERLEACESIDKKVLAIPDTRENDVLMQYAADNGYSLYSGSESDVLGRYYGAAIQFRAKTIIRITSDCPLIDPEIIDKSVEDYYENGRDYTAVGHEGGFPRGLDVEVFTLQSLHSAHTHARLGYEREHVTPYIYEHPEEFDINFITATGKLKRPEIRLTVDTGEDLRLIREIFGRLYKNGDIFGIEKVIELLDQYPNLAAINAHIAQKELKSS